MPGRSISAEEQLKTMGVDRNHPSSVVNVYAPTGASVSAKRCPGRRRRREPVRFAMYCQTLICRRFGSLQTLHENDIPKIQLGQLRNDPFPTLSSGKATVLESRYRLVLSQHLNSESQYRKLKNPVFSGCALFVTATFTSKTKSTSQLSLPQPFCI